MSYHLKLVKALSYYGPVKATKEHPDVFVEDEAIAQAAVASSRSRWSRNPRGSRTRGSSLRT